MLARCLHELTSIRRDAVEAFQYLTRWLGAFTPQLAIGLALSLAAIWVLHPWDELMMERAADFRKDVPQAILIARWLSYLGDFLGFNVLLFVILRVVGRTLGSQRLARLAVASLLCACLAGAAANVSRTLTGRPRPSTPLPDGLYGPSLHSSMHALPSAHAATAFGGALPAVMIDPRIGVPLTLFAASVGWSRMQLNRHHLTDVLVSLILAWSFSLPLSHWALQRRHPFRKAAPSLPSNELATSRHPL
ncbi:MAG: phosphatase PAP2 family protein [Verrucomicrobiaceae bacterium]|nr:phosphatase PAP2 family protein [Verrucomicrobiaceae bacterium]